MAYEKYLTTSLAFDKSSITTPEYGSGSDVWVIIGTTPKLINTSNYLDTNGNRPFAKGLYCNGGGLKTSADLIKYTNDFTVSCWYYIYNKSITEEKNNTIFALYNADIRLDQNVGSSYMCFIYDCEAATSWSVIKYENKIYYDKDVLAYRWCNVTITYKYSTKTIRVYFNGTLTRTITATLKFNYNAPSFIGTCYGGSDTNRFSFKTGYITYFRTWNGVCLSTSNTLYLPYVRNPRITYSYTKNNIINIKFTVPTMVKNDSERIKMPKESDNIIKNMNIKAGAFG